MAWKGCTEGSRPQAMSRRTSASSLQSRAGQVAGQVIVNSSPLGGGGGEERRASTNSIPLPANVSSNNNRHKAPPPGLRPVRAAACLAKRAGRSPHSQTHIKECT